MTLWEIEYYTRPNGNQPVALWLEQLSIDYRKVIEAKIVALAQYGTQLLDTKVLKLIRGSDNDFYELRGGRCRVAVFHSGIARRFVLLHGFIKTRDNERREISRARDMLHEYLQMR
jgi:phage-related protein